MVTEPRVSVAAPVEFSRAVSSLQQVRLRPEVVVETMRAPRRLAPWTHAISAEVIVENETVATGRMVLLGDPDSADAWDGTLRLVTYSTTELDAEMGRDPLLAQVGWSWLIESLQQYGATYTAAGGTVTQTSSARFGDLAGPAQTLEVELRASWTPLADDLRPHLEAWADVLCTAAGLPPVGVSSLRGRP